MFMVVSVWGVLLFCIGVSVGMVVVGVVVDVGVVLIGLVGSR